MRKLKVTEIRRLGADEYREAVKLPLVVVLDDVRSLHNVGSVFRTADAFRVEAIRLCGITARPPDAGIHKTALGAEDTVRWEYSRSAGQAVMELKAAGYRVCAVEQAHGSVMLDDLAVTPGEKYALVFGNEVKGVKQEVVDLCDLCVEIPQHGTKHSLNVSVAAGIVLWEMCVKMS
jgi:tRNA G18 (ribose-2'-O)-methylase SpoU